MSKGNLENLLKNLCSSAQQPADDLKLPVEVAAAAPFLHTLNSTNFADFTGDSQKRHLEVGSDCGMSMQAEVGTQDSVFTDQETLDKREIDLATVVRSFVVANDGAMNASQHVQREPSAPPVDPEEEGLDEMPSPPRLEAIVSVEDEAEAGEKEEDAIYKVMAYKLRDIQVRAFTALNSEVSSFQKRLLQRHRVEKAEMQKKHDEAIAILKEENTALKKEVEEMREKQKELLLKQDIRGKKMGDQCLKIINMLKSDYSLMNCFRRLQKNAREARYINKMSNLSKRLSRQRDAALAFSKLRHHTHNERVRKVEVEAKDRLEDVCRGIMERYESELRGMRAQLEAAHEEVDRSLRQRRQLEENLRQTLMRGMSSMQLEALDLFRSTAEAEREARTNRNTQNMMTPTNIPAGPQEDLRIAANEPVNDEEELATAEAAFQALRAPSNLSIKSSTANLPVDRSSVLQRSGSQQRRLNGRKLQKKKTASNTRGY